MCVEISCILVLLCPSTEEAEATRCAAERFVGLMYVMGVSDRRIPSIAMMDSGVRGEYPLEQNSGILGHFVKRLSARAGEEESDARGQFAGKEKWG